MVAGDSKRVVVIRNISSNLIEEAILILKPDPDAPPKGSGDCKAVQNRTNLKNDVILKEAEFIIDQYIKEHGLIKHQNKRLPPKKPIRFNISVNTIINIFLGIAVLFLLFR